MKHNIQKIAFILQVVVILAMFPAFAIFEMNHSTAKESPANVERLDKNLTKVLSKSYNQYKTAILNKSAIILFKSI